MTDTAGLDRAIAALLRRTSETAILPRYRQLAAHEITDKGGGDPVTVADREAETMLAEGLTRLVPGIAIVGEEAAHADPAVLDRLSGQCWIIDPLDGTHNFASGKPPFGILLALASGGETLSGWIYDCLSGRLCIAHRGQGASVDGEKIVARTTGRNPPVTAVSRVFLSPEESALVDARLAPHYTLVDIPRCAAEQYPRLALGENDISSFRRTLPWDHAAGVLWLNEAGGRAARLDGTAYRVDEHDEPGLIGASSPALWDEFVARLANPA